MKKNPAPVNLKTLKKWKDANVLNLDHPIQRASGQWNNLQQSIFIHSMLVDFIIPALYLVKEKKGKVTEYHLIDGKQRLTTLFAFVADEIILHDKTPNVVLDDKEYTIASKKFSELPEELRDEILGYFFTTYQIEDATNEEIEENFARLNSGTALSKIQLARPKMGTELAVWCNKLVETKFFQHSINLTLAQLRREDNLLMLITGMMLLDNRLGGDFKIKTSASAGECLRFAEYMRTHFDADRRVQYEGVIDYINKAFNGADYKFLKKNNVPVIISIAQIAKERGIPASKFFSLVVEFFSNDTTEAYREASGTGNVKMVNVNIRCSELLGYVMKAVPEAFDEEVSVAPTESEDAEEPVKGTYVIFKVGEDEIVYSIDSDSDPKEAAERIKEQVGYAKDVSYEICVDLTEAEVMELYGEINYAREVA